MKKLRIIGIVAVLAVLVGLVGTGCIGSGAKSTIYKGDSHVLVRGSYGKWLQIDYTIYLYLYNNGEAKMRHVFKDQFSPESGTFKDWENEYHGKWRQDDKNVYLDFEEIGTYASITSNDELRKEPATKNLPPELIETVAEIHLHKEEGDTNPKVPIGEEKGIPGFEAIFAVVGLFAVAYILRRIR